MITQQIQEATAIDFNTAVIIVCTGALVVYYTIAILVEVYRKHRVK